MGELGRPTRSRQPSAEHSVPVQSARDRSRSRRCRSTGDHSYHLLEKDGWGAELVRGLEREPGDIWIDKHRISGFWDTPLDSILRNLGVTTLLFAGINADHCVYATLMDANFHGYDTIMLEDCVATTSPAFCLEATLHNVRFCFGFTVTASNLLKGLSPQ